MFRVKKMKHDHAIEISRLQHKNGLALEEKEFELKHFKDEKVRKIRLELIDSNREIAVLKKENEMMKEITDLNADIFDVKDLVTNLIDKLPEVKINSLQVVGYSKKQDGWTFIHIQNYI